MDHSVLSYIELQAPSWLSVYGWYFSVHIFKDNSLVIWLSYLVVSYCCYEFSFCQTWRHTCKVCWHFNWSIFVDVLISLGVVRSVEKVVKMLCVCQYLHVCVYDSTVSVTVPLVLFRMPTASSCVTPSNVCPLTAIIWSPRFRRPSSAAAPWAHM